MISISTTEVTRSVPNSCSHIWSYNSFPWGVSNGCQWISSVTEVWMDMSSHGCQVHRTTKVPRGVQWLSNGIQCYICTTVRPIDFKLIYRAAIKRTSSSINKHDFTALNIGKTSFLGCLYYIKSYHNIELL